MITDSPVVGTDWIASTSPDSAIVVISVRLPPHASPALAEAWHARIAAKIGGRCPLCDAVADVHPGIKTAAPDEVLLTFHEAVRHAFDCPASEDALEALERACSPNGETFEPKVSPETIDLLGDFLVQSTLRIRQQGMPQPPTIEEEPPC